MKKMLILFLSICIVLSMTACSDTSNKSPQASDDVTASDNSEVNADNESKSSAERPEVSMMLVNGFAAIGAVNMFEENEKGTAQNKYDITLATAPDEVSAKVLSGEVDIASIPTNMAATLYNRSEGQVAIAAVNTLGVVQLISSDDTIQSLDDLKSREVYGCGQGAIPEYTFEYILAANGIDTATDINIEYKSGHEEVSSLMSSGQIEIATIPQPLATKVLEKNSDARIVIDLTEEWNKLDTGAIISQGCVVIQRSLIEDNQEAVANFLEDYERSCNAVHSDLETTAQLCEKFDVLDAATALKAIPEANQVFISGQEMQDGLEPFFEILFEANPQAVGGDLPDDGFYYIP